MIKSESFRVGEMMAFVNALTESQSHSQNKKINKLFNNLDEQYKEIVVNIIFMSLLKSVVLNNEKTIENVDFDLNNGFSFKQWENLYFENLNFKSSEQLFSNSNLGKSLIALYNHFSIKVKDEIYLEKDDLSENYKKFGFKRQELNYDFLNNLKNFILVNYDYVFPKITWMGQDEAFFLTLPNVEPAKLKFLKEMLELSNFLPGVKDHFIKSEDISDIFNHEIDNISIEKIKQEIITKSKSSDEEDKKLMHLENVQDLLSSLEPRLFNIIAFSELNTNQKFIDNMFEEAFKKGSNEDINLPMVAITLKLMKEINLTQKSSNDKLILNDNYFNKLLNFTMLKQVSDDTFEIYVDIKQMQVLKKVMMFNSQLEKKVGGPLEFVVDAEQENRIPHRRLARLLNEKVDEIVTNASVVIEEEEQDGKLTGLYFVCKKIGEPELLKKAIKNYFIRYKYSFSYMANLGSITTDLNEYKKNVINGSGIPIKYASNDNEVVLKTVKQSGYSLPYDKEELKLEEESEKEKEEEYIKNPSIRNLRKL